MATTKQRQAAKRNIKKAIKASKKKHTIEYSAREEVREMAHCEVCGNAYDKAFEVVAAGQHHTFDPPRWPA
jgi:hypothetical protein